MISLYKLPLNVKAKIVKVDDNFLQLQMLAKGLTKGTIIEISRKTLGGSCIYLKSISHAIAIQSELARAIFVEKV